MTSKRKSSGDGTVACNKAQSIVDETFAHKKRRRALKQMQEVTADKDNNKGSSEQQQQQDNNNGGVGTAATQKTMVLPKKRPLAGQPANGAAAAAGPQSAAATPKKQAKASGDEAVDDETLIRETEAALKSLSGGWPGARHSFYRTGHDDDRYESPAFVNLFDEKKIGSASSAHPPPPPPPTATRVDENKNNTNDTKTAQQQQQPPQQQRRDLDNILLNKIDQNNKECEHNKKPDKYAPSKYEPDFNELVDDSSDELEIDMSADGGGGGSGCSGGDDNGDGGGGGDDEDDNDDDDDDENGGCGRGRSRSHTGSGDRLRRKMDVDRRNNNSHVRPDEMMTSLKSESDSSSYDAYLMDKTAFSAFRPVASGSVGESKDPTRLDLPTAVGAAMSPLGPYPPAGATFVVGYTGPGGGLVSNGVSVSAAGGGGHGSTVKHLLGGGNTGGGGGVGVGQVTPVKPVCVKLEDDGCSGGAGDCKADGAVIKMDSPSPLSKQYTILQPAGADSRAATALQDVAREGVLGASVVSAAGGDGLSPRMTSSGGGSTKLLLDPVDGGLMLPGCMNNKGKQ